MVNGGKINVTKFIISTSPYVKAHKKVKINCSGKISERRKNMRETKRWEQGKGTISKLMNINEDLVNLEACKMPRSNPRHLSVDCD